MGPELTLEPPYQETDVSRDWETLYMGADRDGGMVGIGISVWLLAPNFIMREPG
jgi:hypothetical protein